jgi:hypothetical protein
MVAQPVAHLALVVDQDDGVAMAPHASPSIGFSTNEDKGSSAGTVSSEVLC